MASSRTNQCRMCGRGPMCSSPRQLRRVSWALLLIVGELLVAPSPVLGAGLRGGVVSMADMYKADASMDNGLHGGKTMGEMIGGRGLRGSGKSMGDMLDEATHEVLAEHSATHSAKTLDEFVTASRAQSVRLAEAETADGDELVDSEVAGDEPPDSEDGGAEATGVNETDFPVGLTVGSQNATKRALLFGENAAQRPDTAKRTGALQVRKTSSATPDENTVDSQDSTRRALLFGDNEAQRPDTTKQRTGALKTRKTSSATPDEITVDSQDVTRRALLFGDNEAQRPETTKRTGALRVRTTSSATPEDLSGGAKRVGKLRLRASVNELWGFAETQREQQWLQETDAALSSMDTDGNGAVSMNELQNARKGSNAYDVMMQMQRFRAADENQDRVLQRNELYAFLHVDVEQGLHFQEFRRLEIAGGVKVEDEATAEEEFHFHDKNRDGILNHAEFEELMTVHHLFKARAKPRRLIASVERREERVHVKTEMPDAIHNLLKSDFVHDYFFHHRAHLHSEL